jgi:hypothetical protein
MWGLGVGWWRLPKWVGGGWMGYTVYHRFFFFFFFPEDLGDVPPLPIRVVSIHMNLTNIESAL